jgi:hypothetical protein
MQLSNTTSQAGLVQRVERYTRRPYGSSGDELKEIINDINEAFADLMPLILQFNDQMRWDDLNHTDAPIGTINIVSGQEDYKITVDDNSLDILNIVKVRIYPSASATEYEELQRMTPDHPLFANALDPATGETGTPSHFVELGNVIYLYPSPNYAATNGIQIFFQRQQSYFTVTGTSGDDTTEPGIPLPFHELLALKAAHKWTIVNRTDDTNLLSSLNAMISRKEKELRDFTNARHPSRARMTTRLEDNGMSSGTYRNLRFH